MEDHWVSVKHFNPPGFFQLLLCEWKSLLMHKSFYHPASKQISDNLTSDKGDKRSTFINTAVIPAVCLIFSMGGDKINRWSEIKTDSVHKFNKISNTCKTLKIAFAKYPFLLWCLGGKDNLVNHSPVVQCVHKPHSLGQHQFSCKQWQRSTPQHAPHNSVRLVQEVFKVLVH